MQQMKEFSIGFMTDTHVGPTRESCASIEGAYRVFKREGCEVIVNAGDIADRFCPDGYRIYREIADTQTMTPGASREGRARTVQSRFPRCGDFSASVTTFMTGLNTRAILFSLCRRRLTTSATRR